MIFLTLSGSISVGKTLVLDYLKSKEYLVINGRKINKSRILFIEEPVGDFVSFQGYNALAQMNQFTVASQIAINLCMYDLYSAKYKELESGNYDLVISERNIFSGRVFSKTLYELGLLTKYELTVLNSFHDRFFVNLFPSPDFLLLISADPHICVSRIKSRAREGEECLSLDYIKRLCLCYDSSNLSEVYKTSKIIKIINNDQTKNELFNTVDEILRNLPNVPLKL